MNQLEFVKQYIDNNMKKFNSVLFQRSNEAMIEQLEKIILSCQSFGTFTIKVEGFEVITDYIEVQKRLREFYDNMMKKSSSKSRRVDEDNRYNFIDLKGSDIQLLLINYYIAINDEEARCQVIVAVPRVVNKFYFYLNGNYYLPMYQVVDATTYNNSTSKSSKHHSITFKLNLQPIVIYRHIKEISTTQGEKVQAIEYDCAVFSKTAPTVLFILAKYGLQKTLEELQINNVIFFNTSDVFVNDDTMYTFKPKKNPNIFVSVPKMIFNDNSVVQHFIYTMTAFIDAEANINSIFTKDYWATKLGMAFNSANQLAKGRSVLNSIESIYDINTKEQIRLPEEHKKNVYRILRWMIYEYPNLRLKDNMDITCKKIRCAEYIAALYANKLSTNIYRLANIGKRADLKSIKKVIYIQPMYLLKEIVGEPLISYRNTVTDMDSLTPIKFTYKGVSGVGNNGQIPDQFRLLDISNMGILDPDASSPSDPGITGSLVPMLKVYPNGYLSDKVEPLTWETEYKKLFEDYRKIKGLREFLEFKQDVLGEQNQQDTQIARESEFMVDNIKNTLNM